MASIKWNENTGQIGYREWFRSWRQNIETPLGKGPVLTAWIERVRAFEDGSVEHQQMGSIDIQMAGLLDQELLDAILIQEKLTGLIGARVQAMLNPTPIPDPVIVEPPPPFEPPVVDSALLGTESGLSGNLS